MTIPNGSVTGTLFFTIVPLKCEVFVTGCNKFVHLGRVERIFLLVQPHDGSMFDVFNAGETMAWPVLHQGRQKVKILWCQIRTVRKTQKRLQNEFCSKFRACYVVLGRALSWKRTTPSLARFSVRLSSRLR